MKKNTFILSLLAISMLSACVWETKQPYSLATDTSIEEGPKDELILAGMYDPKLESDDHVFYFRVPEFTERFNLVIGSSMSMLYYGDTRIGENLHYDPYIYASDINGDGYREIVFAHNEMRSDGFTVYDIKNAKTLFSQEDMTVEKFGRFASYQYALDIREGELVFLPVLGHFMGPREFEERKIVDWGHLKWSEEKGCYFKWDNVYEIRQMILDSICLKGDETRLVMDSDLKDGEAIDLYHFERDRDYQIRIRVNRLNLGGGLYLDPDLDFIGIDLDSTDKVNCELVYESCKPLEGWYVMEFSTSDITDFDLHEWKFYFGAFEFSFYFKVMQGLAN